MLTFSSNAINIIYSLFQTIANQYAGFSSSVMCTGMEFFYAQSPHTMRGLMSGLLFFVQGLMTTIMAGLLFIFSHENLMIRLNVKYSYESCGFWYYLILVAVAVVVFPTYIFAAKWYKNRDRGELEESEEVFYRLY